MTKRPGHSDPLLLATRQHAGPMRQPIAQSKTLEYRLRAPAFRLGRIIRAMRSGISAFSSAVNSGKQMMELKDEPHVLVAERRERLVGHRADVGVADVR